MSKDRTTNNAKLAIDYVVNEHKLSRLDKFKHGMYLNQMDRAEKLMFRYERLSELMEGKAEEYAEKCMMLMEKYND